MQAETLINPTELRQLPSRQPLRLIDCSFDLTNPTAGQVAYEAEHIPGAFYANLDHDLAAPKSGRNGRHPLPTREAFAQRVAQMGIRDETQVVVYDRSGSMFAVRLWWMLRWVGHAAVAVLDGGLAAWKAEGGAVASGLSPVVAAQGGFTLRDSLVPSANFSAMLANLAAPASAQRVVLDARSPDRFRGENETLDPVAGHVPGAHNRFFKDNLQADGRFKPAAQLRAEFEAVLAGRKPEELIHHCGSGVTACHNLLAMEVAGLPGGTLYPGSWSEWCAQPAAPVAKGSLG